MFKFLTWFFVIGLCLGCGKSDKFLLTRYKLQTDKADTIAYYPKHKIYLIKIQDHGFLDEFKNQFIFIAKSDSIGYKIEDDDLDVRLSNQYLGLGKFGESDSGWFLINNHKIIQTLPKRDSILLSLEKKYPGSFIQESNGFFTILINGKIVDKADYGSIITAKVLGYRNLPYGVYRLEKNVLLKATDDGHALLSQNDGLYFVPSPGFSVIKFRTVNDILNGIKEQKLLQPIPKQLEIL